MNSLLARVLFTFTVVVAVVAQTPKPAPAPSSKTVAYFSMQLPGLPPLPLNPFPELNVYEQGEGLFFYDDRQVDYDLLHAETEQTQLKGGARPMDASDGPMSPEPAGLKLSLPVISGGTLSLYLIEADTSQFYEVFFTVALDTNAWSFVARGVVGQTNFPRLPYPGRTNAFYVAAQVIDTDADGVSDALEHLVLGTNPTVADTDGDGIPDGWEVQYGLNPLAKDAGGDADNDGLTNLEEYQSGTYPDSFDTDGDGLPDAYEIYVTHTLPDNADTGNTGITDGYKDSDGDGFTDIKEYQNGTDPFAFNPHPGPRNVTVKMATGATSATVQWDTTSGPVVRYVIHREDANFTFQDIGLVQSPTTSFVDTQPINDGSAHRYRVKAIYPAGESLWSDPVIINQADPKQTIKASIVRGPQGQWYLVVSSMPKNTAAIRINSSPDGGSGLAWYPLFDFNPLIAGFYDVWWHQQFYTTSASAQWEVPVAALQNGVYAIPSSSIPDFAHLQFAVQSVMQDGTLGAVQSISQDLGPFTSYSRYGIGKVSFLDATAQMKQNISFLLKAANATEPFSYEITPEAGKYVDYYDYQGNSGYVASDFYRREGVFNSNYAGQRLIVDEFRPFQENYFFKNWIFQTGHLDGQNGLTTGVGYSYRNDDFGYISRRWIFSELHVFPVYDYVASRNQALLEPVLSSADTQWIYHEDLWNTTNDPRVGISRDGQDHLQIASGLRNLYGLPYVSLKIGGWFDPYPISTVYPGETYTEVDQRYWGVTFQEVANPILHTISYYFAGEPDPVPEDTAFDGIAAVTPPLFAPVGRVSTIMGWAKQQIVNGFANKYAYLGQYFDKAYKTDGNGNRTSQETGILSEYGEFFPTEPGHIILTTKPDPDQNNLQGECHVYALRISLDANHDGTMDETIGGPDNTSAQPPFTFWVNNDHDHWSHTGDPGHEVPITGTNAISPLADCSGQGIQSLRDLEDFARLWICGMPALSSNAGYQVTLSWNASSGSPAINLFNAVENDGGTGYLTNLTNANAQLSGNDNYVLQGPGWKIGTVSASQSFTFPSTFFTNGGNKYFLFEGAGIGHGKLVMTISQGTNVLAQTSAWFDLRDVKDMFEHVHIENVTDYSPNTFLSTYKEDNFVYKTADEDKKIVVFVHGWRMGVWDYKSFSESMFKRLYWQGFHGRFVSVRWPTKSKDDFKLPILDFFTYNESELRAFKSARGVSDYLNHLKQQRFPDYSVNVCAHSMGNIVMMEALKRDLNVGRTNVNNYVLMQAAVPAHCYDTNLANYAPFMSAEQAYATPDAYRGYPGAISAALGNRIVNFYNTNDYALAAGPFGNWEANQTTYKPNLSKGYTSDGTNGFLDGVLLTENREVKAFVARPRSKAVGAQPSVGGVIYSLEQVDLTGRFNFLDNSDEHSAQFNWNIQRLNGFYRQLGIGLGVFSPPTP